MTMCSRGNIFFIFCHKWKFEVAKTCSTAVQMIFRKWGHTKQSKTAFLGFEIGNDRHFLFFLQLQLVWETKCTYCTIKAKMWKRDIFSSITINVHHNFVDKSTHNIKMSFLCSIPLSYRIAIGKNRLLLPPPPPPQKKNIGFFYLLVYLLVYIPAGVEAIGSG